jgi:hypothetical protein
MLVTRCGLFALQECNFGGLSSQPEYLADALKIDVVAGSKARCGVAFAYSASDRFRSRKRSQANRPKVMRRDDRDRATH